ncbi:hypothetical protein [Ideonella sp. BN130291]|uniref:hypothetical protein n=1 Tax=Ideonella sp. BN130291 TaxID=3112940 RepID=UPI002E25E47E|nr:hypothetical protein [Ideonella sp. BN130291]
MNAPLLPEVLLLRDASEQTALPLAADGVLRYLWEGRFGAMLIEVIGDKVMVNGQVVTPVEQPDADSRA